MTAISFVFGTFPLLVASGPAAASRQAVGTAVFGGMLVATIATVIFVDTTFFFFFFNNNNTNINTNRRCLIVTIF